MPHENEELLRRGYKAFAEGDIETIDGLFADDITWHSTGESPFAGDYEGKQAVFEMWSRIPEETDEFSQSLHDVLANDEHGVAMVETSVSRGGESYSGRAVHVYHFDDGKVSEVFIQSYDEEEVNDFWRRTS